MPEVYVATSICGIGRGLGAIRLARLARSITLAILLLMFISLIPSSMPGVEAADVPVFDLELNDGYEAPFALENIKPGDVGSKVVQLRNVGNVDGQIAIWVSNVQESDYAGDGAHLDDYLYFEVNSAEISTDLRMPCLVRELPSAPLGGCYIWLLNVRAGQTVEISWFWEFLETYQSQNEAQGDSLSFDINYLLGEMPPPNLSMSWLEVQVLDQVTMALLDSECRSVDLVLATDTAHSMSLTIPEGTACMSDDGRAVRRIAIAQGESAPVGAGQALVSPVFSVSAFVSSDEEVSGFIDQAVLRINYDPDLLPSLTEAVGVYQHVEGSTWAPLPMTTESPPQVGQCGGIINSSGEVGVIATFDPYESAYFLPSGLNIDSSKQDWWNPIIFVSRVGDEIKVTVMVTNVGQVPGEENITLTINGQNTLVEQVALGPMESKEVTFDVTGLEEGEHEIEVSGLTGNVLVGTQVNWWLIMAVCCLPFAVVVAYFYSSRRWKEMKGRMDSLQSNVTEVESKLAESEMARMIMDERQQAEAAKIRTNAVAPTLPASSIQSSKVEESLDSFVVSAEPRPQEENDWVGSTFNQVDQDYVPKPVTQLPLYPAPPVPRTNGKSLEEAISIETSILLEEEVGAHQMKVAKEFILSRINSQGMLVIEEAPPGQNGMVAMAALSQLVEEGKIRTVQEKRRTVYLMNSP
ncbi:MAG: hypothetical protein LUQ16_09895 [Methanomassiliicoccales archaeon]|nr:hypothetical protein [Methanomassiliicoccales archaeon]